MRRHLRRVGVVLLLTSAAVLTAGPLPDLNPVPRCLFGCGEFVPLTG